MHLSGSADRHWLRTAVAAGAAVLPARWLAGCGAAPPEARDTMVLIDRGARRQAGAGYRTDDQHETFRQVRR